MTEAAIRLEETSILLPRLIPYHVLSGVNGFNFSLTSYLSAANAFTTTHDPSLLDAILYNNPTVHYSAVGSSQVENNNGNFGGDTFVSSVNGDVFDGRTNFNGDFLGGDTVDYSHTPGPSGVTVSLVQPVRRTLAAPELMNSLTSRICAARISPIR